MRRFISLCLRNHVLVHTLWFVLLVAGVLAAIRIPAEEFPDINLSKAIVRVSYQGASPAEVEAFVTRPIEEEIGEVDGVDVIVSRSLQDLSEIIVFFEDDLPNFDAAFLELQTAVGRVRELPDGALLPEITKIEMKRRPIVSILVGGTVDEEALRLAARDLRQAFTRIPGVLDAVVFERESEVQILVDPEKATGHDLTVGEIAAALASQNQNTPAGTLGLGGGSEALVRTLGTIGSVEEIEDIRVHRGHGSPVRIGDLAQVRWGYKAQDTRFFFKGKPAVFLTVAKRPAAHAFEVREAIEEAIRNYRHQAPSGLEVATIDDKTARIRERITLLVQTVLGGAVLVFLSLLLFVGLRSAVLTVLGIVFSFLVALIVLSATGETINVISLIPLIIVAGMVADDAIVIIENIQRHLEMGKPVRQAVVEGTAEVAVPVITSTVTTMFAFLPLLLIPGYIGEFVAIIPKTVCYVLLASLLEAVVLLPVHISVWSPALPPVAGGETATPRRGGPLSWGWLQSGYERGLRLVLRYRYATVVSVLALAVLAGVTASRLPVNFMPGDYDSFHVSVEMPADASIEATQQVCARVEAILRDMPPDWIREVFIHVGASMDREQRLNRGPRFAQVDVDVQPRDVRPVTVKEVAREAMARLQEHSADLLPARFEIVEHSDRPPLGRPVEVRILGDDLTDLRELATPCVELLEQTQGVLNVRTDLVSEKHEVQWRLDPERAVPLGLTVADLAGSLRDANDGRIASVWKRGDQDVDIRVLYDLPFRQSPAQLGQIPVRTPQGRLVALADFAGVEIRRGLRAIERFNQRRVLTITADLDLRLTNSVAVNRKLAALRPELLAGRPGYTIELAGEYKTTGRSIRSMLEAFGVCLLLVFCVLAAQFRSFVQPLVVMLTVPFALIGVVVAMVVFGDSLTMGTLIAMVGLAGLVVNDSIVLVDFISNRRQEIPDLLEAVVEASKLRLRPILLTTITTAVGLLPMAIGVGGRSPLWGPLATAFIFGLVFATALTLLVIPAAYVCLEDLQRLRSRSDGEEETPLP